MGLFEVLILESLYSDWEGSTEKKDLSVSRQESDDILYKGLEFGRQKFVCL